MKITTESRQAIAIETQALMTYIFEGDDAVGGRIGGLDQSGRWIAAAAREERRTDRQAARNDLGACPRGPEGRAVALSGGRQEETSSRVADLRKLAGAGLRFLKTRGVKRIAFLVREGDVTAEAAEAVVEGLIRSRISKAINTRPTRKTVGRSNRPRWQDGMPMAERRQGNTARNNYRWSRRILRRDLANEPSNKMTPTTLADQRGRDGPRRRIGLRDFGRETHR